jgi:cytochrome b561
MEFPKRYHPVHVTLHWLVALGIFINLYLGIFVFTQRGRGVFQFQTLHMVVGITILVLLLVRLVMRFTVKRPADATAGHKLLDILAKVVHYGLYLSVLAVTILGLVFALQTNRLQSAFTGSRTEFNGPPPGFTPTAPGTSPNGRGGGFPGGFGFGSPLLIVHRLVAYLVALLLGIHILAALYHQFFRRDNLLARMWYGSR